MPRRPMARTPSPASSTSSFARNSAALNSTYQHGATTKGDGATNQASGIVGGSFAEQPRQRDPGVRIFGPRDGRRRKPRRSSRTSDSSRGRPKGSSARATMAAVHRPSPRSTPCSPAIRARRRSPARARITAPSGSTPTARSSPTSPARTACRTTRASGRVLGANISAELPPGAGRARPLFRGPGSADQI